MSTEVAVAEPKESKKRKDEGAAVAGSRTGGVYVPPFKLQRLLAEQEKEGDHVTQQKLEWEALRKSINGYVNKVNVSNIGEIVQELFEENLIRGRGLCVRALLRAQLASPGFTHIFAAILAVLNTKLPEIGELTIHRLILQFRRGYRLNDKILSKACVSFMAHLVNQRVAHELMALELCMLLMENPTDDSIEICCEFLLQCGQTLLQVARPGAQGILNRLRAIMTEGVCEKKTQYTIENILAAWRDNFKDYPSILPELDLVEEDEQIAHRVDLLDDSIRNQEMLNVFKPASTEQYEAENRKWRELKKEILDQGSEKSGDADSDASSSSDSEDEREEERKQTQTIVDHTEEQLVLLRKGVYLNLVSALSFEECTHKLLKMNIMEGLEIEVCQMLIDCCAQERTYLRFYPQIGERLCQVNPAYEESFVVCWKKTYDTVHRLESNKLRNTAKFFAHLLYTDAIPWTAIETFRLTEQETTSASRIFIKHIFQELAEQMGMAKLQARLREPSLRSYFDGIFPVDNPSSVRFAINFFTQIGLGGLTDEMRMLLQKGR